MRISHAVRFDYLDPAEWLFSSFVSITDNEIRYLSASGNTVVLVGTGIAKNGQVDPTGTLDQIVIYSAAEEQLAGIVDIDSRALPIFSALQSGQGLPFLFRSDDVLDGSGAPDMIEGYGGNDIISGFGGDDILGGGDGNDVLAGGPGNDLIYGGRGSDTAVFEGRISDWTSTFEGNVILATSSIDGSFDRLEGVERLQFDDRTINTSALTGDTFQSAGDGKTVFGTAGSDIMLGTAGSDFFSTAYGGRDVIHGGPGDDTYTIGLAASISEEPAEGIDQINLLNPGTGPYLLPDNFENLALVNTNLAADFVGNDLDNRLFTGISEDSVLGGGGNDEIHLFAGDDVADGGSGNNTIYAGTGHDQISSGPGDDLLVGGGGNDVVRGGGGADTIHGDQFGAQGKQAPAVANSSASGGGTAGDSPNILFIAIDDLAAVSAIFQHPIVRAVTPNLDAFFSQSSVFTSAHAAVPLCNPSRASILYGVDSDTSGIHTNADVHVGIHAAFQSLPAFLGENGYVTANAGKIFHDNGDRGDPAAFQQRYSDSRANDWQPTSWDASNSGILQGFSPDVPDEAFSDARLVKFFEDFLSGEHADPFFFAFGIFRPHSPQTVPQQYYDLYPLEDIPLPDYQGGDLGNLAELALAYSASVNPGTNVPDDQQRFPTIADPMEVKLAIQSYLAAVSYADAVFGRVIAALEASIYAGETAIVLWSDHGFHIGEKTHFGKHTLWEQGTQAPLAFHMPGQTEGQVISNTVSLIDLYKTVAAIAGLNAPDHVQGVNLLPLIEDPDMPFDRPAVTEFYGNYAVRTDDWRYIQYADGSEELYDHRADPSEITNLAGDPDYRSVMDGLAAYIPGGHDILSGGGGDDTVYAGGGNDAVAGNAGNDLLYGDAGNDKLYGGGGNDTLYGGDGDDLLQGNAGDDAMFGGAGNDIYFVNAAGDSVTELAGEGTDEVRVAGISYALGDNLENLRLMSGHVSGTGNSLANEINGSNGNNTILGLGGDDVLRGRDGSDTIDGGDGNDVIAGNAGRDFLTGGAGADRFVFTAIADSAAGPANAEVILDFSQAQGDIVDLHYMDADSTTAGNQAFSWIGGAAFSGTAGELRFAFAGNTTTVYGDTNGDGTADFALWLTGQIGLVAGDFVL